MIDLIVYVWLWYSYFCLQLLGVMLMFQSMGMFFYCSTE